MAARLQPDVALLDQRPPDVTGIDSALSLRSSVPDLRVVVFSAYLDLAGEERAAFLGIQTISKVDRASLFGALDAHRQELLVR